MPLLTVLPLVRETFPEYGKESGKPWRVLLAAGLPPETVGRDSWLDASKKPIFKDHKSGFHLMRMMGKYLSSKETVIS